MVARAEPPAPAENAGLARKKVTPIDNKVVIQVIIESQTEGGILLSDQAKSRGYITPRAWVIAAGPQCKQVKEGDCVHVPADMMSYLLTYDGDRLLIIPETVILDIIDHPPPKPPLRVK